VFVWCLGVLLLLLSVLTAFVGYVLPWGQMSFWGATVITSLASALPVVGNPLVSWLWGGLSVENATFNAESGTHRMSHRWIPHNSWRTTASGATGMGCPFRHGGNRDADQGCGPRNAVANADSSETARQTFIGNDVSGVGWGSTGRMSGLGRVVALAIWILGDVLAHPHDLLPLGVPASH